MIMIYWRGYVMFMLITIEILIGIPITHTHIPVHICIYVYTIITVWYGNVLLIFFYIKFFHYKNNLNWISLPLFPWKAVWRKQYLLLFLVKCPGYWSFWSRLFEEFVCFPCCITLFVWWDPNLISIHRLVVRFWLGGVKYIYIHNKREFICFQRQLLRSLFKIQITVCSGVRLMTIYKHQYRIDKPFLNMTIDSPGIRNSQELTKTV